MRVLCLTFLLAVAAVPTSAQRKSLLFTGRFPFVSLDDVNERAGGSITRLEEFDISFVTPDPAAPFVARTFWLTSTAMQTLGGDAYNDRNYTRFHGFKGYFDRWNFAAPFVKVIDQFNCTPDKVFWTVRDTTSPPRNYTVKVNNGTATVAIAPGDFFRFLNNGNIEYFITQAQIMQAAGPQNGAFAAGASALCQDSAGNLYYSPAEGGHYVSGNTGAPVFHNDGSIMMIRAADITYDGLGNVLSVVPNSAICLFSETTFGPMGQPSLRAMLGNAGAVGTGGNPITISNNVVGLALDPNGGTVVASLPWGTNQTYEVVPNLIWTDDGGSYGATVFSTAINPANNGQGSIAVINGVRMGSTTTPATGAYWGVRLDIANFQPTTMGFAVVNEPLVQPFLADAPNHGAILPADLTIEWDFWPGPSTFCVPMLFLGPLAAGQVPLGLDISFLVGPDSYPAVFGLAAHILSFPPLLANPAGYANLSLPRPTQPGLTGLSLIVHGVKLTSFGAGFAISNPMIAQFK